MNRVVVSKEFSRHPAGRFQSDGPFSGEAFRQRFLVPALKRKDKLILDMDGARGYGSSFLEEAFGGLVRAGYAPLEIREFIEVNTTDKSLELEIWSYVDDAARMAQ